MSSGEVEDIVWWLELREANDLADRFRDSGLMDGASGETLRCNDTGGS